MNARRQSKLASLSHVTNISSLAFFTAVSSALSRAAEFAWLAAQRRSVFADGSVEAAPAGDFAAILGQSATEGLSDSENESALASGGRLWYDEGRFSSEGSANPSASFQASSLRVAVGDLPRISLGSRLICLLCGRRSCFAVCSKVGMSGQRRLPLNEIHWRNDGVRLFGFSGRKEIVYGKGRQHLREKSEGNAKTTEGAGEARTSSEAQGASGGRHLQPGQSSRQQWALTS